MTKKVRRKNIKVRTSKKDFSIKTALKSLGPGLITGASDDDPSGIATYSQAGASFGLGMLWMALFLYPLIAVVQEMCARIGIVKGDGLAFVMRKKYSKKVVLPIASLLLIANTINIGADIGAMGASIRLLLPQLPSLIPTLLFTGLILFAEISLPYHRYVKILKYLTLSLFAYIITAMIVGGSFEELFIASIVPHIEFTSQFAMMFVAILGTTISPYLFFWQTSQEAEEDLDKKKIQDIDRGEPHITKKELKVMRTDVAIGMFFSQLIMWAIIVTTAGSLHTQGITDIQTSDQAAKALEPVVKSFPNSGEISKVVFALGIIGTGLLAVPILAGSSAYALSDVFGWKQGLNKKFGQAKSFYVVIAVSTLIGLWINFSDIDPIKALVYAAVINGVTAVPILYTIMKIANDKKILQNRINRRLSNVIGWATFMVMGVSVAVMFATFIFRFE